MRPLDKIRVYKANVFCGEVERLSDGSFAFSYNRDYIKNNGKSVHPTLPIREEPYMAMELFPAFEQHCPEGRNLVTACLELKLDRDDKLSILGYLGDTTTGDVEFFPGGNDE